MRTPHILLMTLIVTLVVAACGDSEPGTETTTGDAAPSGDVAPNGEEMTAGDARLAHAQCMRDEGIEDYPDPQITEGGLFMAQGSGALNLDDPEVQRAREACAPILEDIGGMMGNGDGPDEEQVAEMQEQVLAFAQCMREQGIDFPDPDVSGGAMRITPGDGVDADSPGFQDAMARCQETVGMGDGRRFGVSGGGGGQ